MTYGSLAVLAVLFLPACVPAALAAPAEVAGETAADGQTAYDAGRIEEARRIWGDLAISGDPTAAYAIGLLYDLGKGTAPDPQAAFAWYLRAAEKGLPAAAFNVAVMLDAGHGTPRDTAAAAIWYARAGARGHARAQFDLGQLYEAGEGVPRNPQSARSWYHLAAKNGLDAAAPRLAAAGAGPFPVGAQLPIAALPAAPIGRLRTDATGNDPVPVEIVWSAPAEAMPVVFFVEVVSMDPIGDPTRDPTRDPTYDPTGPHRVFAGYTELTAVALNLAPSRYAWRLYTVARTAAHYAVSGWTEFTLGARSR